MTSAVPVPTRLLKARIHEFAESVAARLNFRYGAAIEPLVVRLGGRIEYKTADLSAGKLPESIVVRAINDFVIYLPSITSIVRDRFTIAHELGHLFLHYPLAAGGRNDVVMTATRWVDESNEALQRAEWEANWFAAAFLMPSSDFRTAYSENHRSIETTAAMFGVSVKAAQIRAQSLRL
ncbi:ImmA/IrrE family metallo-endopeptidase [Methylobacterium symbioticum]|uniref:ImmA/IrrE family metallo-endopeptidase n=1 Tax=Methylobacterium symbioticum TaxID=2584084 RepID=UPI00115A0AFD|nr:ImmA/IrrE family metallo-endopeptidase [Methylobacterium symbioticum]